ncbi:MAG: hypothetical protein ACFBZ8_01245 [Opitutales bacterium]
MGLKIFQGMGQQRGKRIGGCALLLLLSLSACRHSTDPREVNVRAEPFQPANTLGVTLLPGTVQRVILLPIHYTDANARFLDELDQNLARELTLSRRFEVLSISREALYEAYGTHQLSPVYPLPPDLFDTLIERYDADALIFTELTTYEPYKPIAIGLRLRLVSLESGQSLWAFDHLFNSGDPRVLAGARQFTELRNTSPFPLNTAHGTLQSPRRFSSYCAALAFSTLPPRQPDPLDPSYLAPAPAAETP